jgi:hypothetical protein
MRKIIYNRQYYTDKAEKIGTAGGVDLYRKRTREFFLCDGSKITPLTNGLARDWVKSNLSADTYQRLFDPAKVNNNRVTLSITVEPETKSKLEELSGQTDKSISRIIDELVETV